MLFISHHLEEVFEIADEITVMRDGSVVAQGVTTEFTPASVAELMFGRIIDSSRVNRRADYQAGKPLLVLKDVSTQRLHNVSFSVSGGEILAVTGDRCRCF